MKINDVKKLTGLTAKALRLYESKGTLDEWENANSFTENEKISKGGGSHRSRSFLSPYNKNN